jgi:ParB family chromosome partitioning protein
MTDTVPEILMVPVHAINVLNPRARNRKVFNELVASIAHLGLKKPITVSRRPVTGIYDLVCGQGRLEAFIALGQKEIPAIVVEVTEEDCFVMSLVENLARRNHSSMELVSEIGSLKERGYSVAEIAAKTDFSTEYIYSICYLLENGEERLINGVEKGIIPFSIAMEIAKAKDVDVQEALAEAYEAKTLPGNQMLAIRRIIEIRNTSGKGMRCRGGDTRRDRSRTTADSLVRAYRKRPTGKRPWCGRRRWRKAAYCSSSTPCGGCWRTSTSSPYFAPKPSRACPCLLPSVSACRGRGSGRPGQGCIRAANRDPTAGVDPSPAVGELQTQTVRQISAHRPFHH